MTCRTKPSLATGTHLDNTRPGWFCMMRDGEICRRLELAGPRPIGNERRGGGEVMRGGRSGATQEIEG